MSMKETVIEVIDGDTFKTRTRSIRLANVYAPELGSPGGAAAKRKLESLIDGKVVSIIPTGRKSYNRTVANVEVNGNSVNRMMNSFLKR